MGVNITTPVAFMIFNRPDTTARVFEEIRKARPRKLLVVADGPRIDKVGEQQRCIETREIINSVDWECEVFTNFSEVNLGCKKRISSGIDWIFSKVEEAIILEDDCLPNQSFFRYCQELLEVYREDEKVMLIAGVCKIEPLIERDESYYFSSLANIWGWATWKSAWEKYDIYMENWRELKNQNRISQIVQNNWVGKYFTEALDQTCAGKIDTWDFQWFYSIVNNGGMCITPTRNLVSNIGFGNFSTNTHEDSIMSNLGTSELQFPLVHPINTKVNKEYDYLEGIKMREALKCNKLPYFLYSNLKKIYKAIRRRIT